MDTNVLLLSILFGAIGMGMAMYGKKASRMVPLGAGVLLMVVPYFITNVWLSLLVCGAITASPWYIRES